MVLTSSLGWPVMVSERAIVVACRFAVGVGLVFLFYTAHCVRLDPIDALRSRSEV